jgi:uncharacterized protein YkwD
MVQAGRRHFQGHLIRRMQKTGCKLVRNSLFFILLLALNFFLLDGDLLPVDQSGRNEYFNTERIERELLELVNKERLEGGRHPLRLHPVLNDIAFKHSLKMVGEGKLSHRFPNYKTLPERMMDAGLYFLSTGENVAFSPVILASSIHKGFMQSPGHRENIMASQFTHCGIKLARSGDDFYVTQVFAQLYEPLKVGAVETLLEEYFKSRFLEEFNGKVIFLEAVKPYARISSQLYIKDKKLLKPFIQSLPDEWGKFEIVNLLSPRIEDIKVELEKEIRGKRFSGAAVGVSTTRGQNYPGGAYSVAVLLIDAMARSWTPETFRTDLLDAINRLRRDRGFSPLKMDHRLTETFFPAAMSNGSLSEEKYRERLSVVQQRAGKSSFRIFNFTADHPSKLPPDLIEFLLGRSGGSGKIGILVHQTSENGVPANYFIVTVVL